jgi:ABC-type glycerol-3-phosphate transport system substrate-binding protein
MKTSKFQIIFLIVFIAFIIAGVIAFATFKGSDAQDQIPAVTVWGTFPKNTFDNYVVGINNTLANHITVNYTEKQSSTIEQDFVSALARGNGPDVVLLPADMLLPAEDKLLTISYSTLPQGTFQSTFIDEGRIYLRSTGAVGIPFVVDPLVMYWNRDMFNTAGIPLPPKYWDEFAALNKKLTIKNDNGTVSQSAVAMGDFSNVVNAREILATLLFQSGNPITSRSATNGVMSTLTLAAAQSPLPALGFFSKFVDPNDANYSWNHAWPDSKTAFLSGKLATYFGLASELYSIRAKNPNLNFDASAIPQLRQGGFAATYGRIYGFSIVRASRNTSAAFQVISTLTQPQYLATLSAMLYLPSVSRSVISAGSTDPYITLFNQQALISKTWLDAGYDQSNRIFGNMIQTITSGQKSDIQALQEGTGQYNALLNEAAGTLDN